MYSFVFRQQPNHFVNTLMNYVLSITTKQALQPFNPSTYLEEPQGCGVGGIVTDSNSDLPKIFDSDSRLQTFKNFRLRLPTPTLQHKGEEVWLLTNL